MSGELEKTAETTEEEVDVTEAEEVVEDADNDNEAEFSDNDGEESAEESDDKEKPKPVDQDKPWKNEKNAEAAAKRREAERRREAAKQAEIKKTRNEAIIEALGGVNPYTNEKMVDEADVEEFLTMKEIEKQGKDPVSDYSRFLKSKAKEQREAAQAEARQEELFRKDREDFQAKHPDVKLNELFDDELFKTFALGKVGRLPMTQIYDEYKAFEKLSEERAKTKAAQILANADATPGKLSHQTPTPAKSVKDMSKAEFEAMVERVKRGEQK